MADNNEPGGLLRKLTLLENRKNADQETTSPPAHDFYKPIRLHVAT